MRCTSEKRDVEERTIRQKGQEPEASHRNWPLRSPEGREKGTREEVRTKNPEDKEGKEGEAIEVLDAQTPRVSRLPSNAYG